MNRRDIIKYTALITGTATVAPVMSSLFISCHPGNLGKDETQKLFFFNREELDFVQALVDTILPKTDSPSGSEAGVHHMIDTMVGRVYEETYKSNYRIGFEALQKFLHRNLKETNFIELPSDQKLALLQEIESSEEDTMKNIQAAYTHIKQQSVAYYLATEEVGTQFLNYLPVPGAYEPCIPLDEVNGKAWAL